MDGKDEQVSETATANKENVDPSLPSVPRKRQRRVERTLIERKEQSAERTPVLAVVVRMYQRLVDSLQSTLLPCAHQ